ncbi:galectin-3-binding protein B-like [Oncorhynchus masou masou]|uniref:galectin-3-binding protein B-like n=1 Tax=Oncorhynchus masou masou TaxID=90313 RepID=UPI00318333E9
MSGEYCLISCVLLLMVSLSVGLQNGNMRLVGGELALEGRVEIYYNGQWGTVCDDNWDITEAQVVCRYLNYPGALTAVVGGTYGQGSGPIWMDDLNCEGTEKDLSHCLFKGWGVTDCQHAEDAGVVCERESSQNSSRVYTLDHNTGLSNHMGVLFDSGRDCDFDIMVRVANSAVETICVHKLIVTLDPNASILNTTQEENLSNLNLDVSLNCRPHVTDFLRYLYTRQINVTMSSAQCIHKMASDWGLKQLQEAAGRLFTWLLPDDASFQTQTSLYEYSVHTGDTVLQETCLRYLAWNCESLIRSPAWTGLALGTVKALLARSDVVVPDEAFLLKSLEDWVLEQGNSSTHEDQVAILNHIRFPMIAAEDLFNLKAKSELYMDQQERYNAGMLQGFQFNALPFQTLAGGLLLKKVEYTPRIYTGKPWSFTFSSKDLNTFRYVGHYSHSGQNLNSLSANFDSPVHNSAFFSLFKKLNWNTRVFIHNYECSNSGISCPSLPMVSLTAQNNRELPQEYQDSIRYLNKVVLMCEGEFVFHVQDFASTIGNGGNLAQIPANISAGQTYPCHSDQFSYRVVVQPVYTTEIKEN